MRLSFFSAGLHGASVFHLLEGLIKTGIGTEGGEKLNTEVSKKDYEVLACLAF